MPTVANNTTENKSVQSQPLTWRREQSQLPKCGVCRMTSGNWQWPTYCFYNESTIVTNHYRIIPFNAFLVSRPCFLFTGPDGHEVKGAWLLASWVRIPLEAWMFLFVFLCCVVLFRQRPLRRDGHSSKEVLPSGLTRLRNLRCEAAKVLTRTVELLMMIIFSYKGRIRRWAMSTLLTYLCVMKREWSVWGCGPDSSSWG
jgi:hypothetical protein